MRKALVIFLLALLPFQFVWGAAAGYCQHEQGSEVTHFGHHFHKHQAKVVKASDGSGDSVKQPVGDDADCMSCHMSCASVVSNASLGLRADQVEQVVPTVGREYTLLIVPSIDRPKWAALS